MTKCAFRTLLQTMPWLLSNHNWFCAAEVINIHHCLLFGYSLFMNPLACAAIAAKYKKDTFVVGGSMDYSE